MTDDNDINEFEEIAKFCSALAELEEAAADGDNGGDEQEEDTRNVDENQSSLDDWGETE